MDTTRRTIIRGMAAAPVAAMAGGLLVPDTALAAPAKPKLTLTYEPADTEGYLRGIRWLTRKYGGRHNAMSLPLRPRESWAFHPVRLDKIPGWPTEKAPQPAVAYNWAPRDHYANDTSWNWWPQGITTYYDATGRNGTRMMVSWYDKNKVQGARIALIDRRAADPRYHYIKLVTAKPDGNGGYIEEVDPNLHAGGLAWYRNRLYVTDSEQNALLVFNTDDIYWTGDPHAPWSLPLSRIYKADANEADLKFSQVAVDRTSLASPFRRTTLIVNGFEKADQSQSIGRWSFAYGPSGSLITEGKTATAADVYTIHRGSGIPQGRGVQGAVTVRNTMYLSVSRGAGYGYLSTASLGTNQEGTAEVKWQVPRGPEDLSYDGRKRWMWGLGERYGYRTVYAIKM